jgi:hypothetical protein
VLDLETLSWSKAETCGASTSASSLPPCAGHKLVAWGPKVLLVGGHVKRSDLPTAKLEVRLLDQDNYTWAALETKGTRLAPYPIVVKL